MDLRAAARDVIESKGGIAKSADFVAAGIRAVDVVSLCNAGYLDRSGMATIKWLSRMKPQRSRCW